MSKESDEGDRLPPRRAPQPGGAIGGDPGGADRGRAAALRRARLRGGRHRGDRPRRRASPGAPSTTTSTASASSSRPSTCRSRSSWRSGSRTARSAPAPRRRWRRCGPGAEMFLEACTVPEVAADRPPRRALGARLGPLARDRRRARPRPDRGDPAGGVDAGAIAEQPVRPLAHVLMGALDEAAMLVARAEDPERRGPKWAARSTPCWRR